MNTTPTPSPLPSPSPSPPPPPPSRAQTRTTATPPSRSAQRRQRLLHAEQEMEREEAEAFTVTEEELKLLWAPFADVKTEFFDLDGLQWTKEVFEFFEMSKRGVGPACANSNSKVPLPPQPSSSSGAQLPTEKDLQNIPEIPSSLVPEHGESNPDVKTRTRTGTRTRTRTRTRSRPASTSGSSAQTETTEHAIQPIHLHGSRLEDAVDESEGTEFEFDHMRGNTKEKKQSWMDMIGPGVGSSGMREGGDKKGKSKGEEKATSSKRERNHFRSFVPSPAMSGTHIFMHDSVVSSSAPSSLVSASASHSPFDSPSTLASISTSTASKRTFTRTYSTPSVSFSGDALNVRVHPHPTKHDHNTLLPASASAFSTQADLDETDPFFDDDETPIPSPIHETAGQYSSPFKALMGELESVSVSLRSLALSPPSLSSSSSASVLSHTVSPVPPPSSSSPSIRPPPSPSLSPHLSPAPSSHPSPRLRASPTSMGSIGKTAGKGMGMLKGKRSFTRLDMR